MTHSQIVATAILAGIISGVVSGWVGTKFWAWYYRKLDLKRSTS